MKAEKEDTKTGKKGGTASSGQITCAVCFDKLSPATAKLDPGHRAITCQRCGLSVHRRCGGAESTMDEVDSFTCELCSAKAKTPKICFICGKTQGFLRKLEKGKWVHPICALLTDDLEVADFSALKFVALRPLTPQGTVPQCQYCSSTEGQRLQCSHPGCLKATHAFCAFDHKSPGSEGWQIEFGLAPANAENIGEAKKYLEQCVPKAAENEPGETAQQRVTRGSRKKEQYDSRGKNTILAARGGKVTVLCEAHRIPQHYCICTGTKSKGKKEERKEGTMIACDMCDNWYHDVCIGMSAPEIQQTDEYICRPCQDFHDFKKGYLLDEAKGAPTMCTPQELLTASDWVRPLYPHLALKLKLVDFLLLGDVFTRRANLLLSSQASIGLECAHLLHSTELPLGFFNICAKLKARIEGIGEFDATMEKQEPELIVKGIIDSEYSLIPENCQANDKELAKCSADLGMYRDTYRISTRTSQKIAGKAALLETLHSLATKFESEMESTEAEAHLKLLESYAGPENFQNEIQFLKDMLEQCKSWEDKVEQTFKQIAQSQSNNKDLLVLPSQIPEVDRWLEKVAAALKMKPDLSAIGDLIQQSEAHPIKRKSTIQRLEAERAKYAEWEKQHNTLMAEGATLSQFQELFKNFIGCGAGHFERMMAALKAYAEFLKWNIVGERLLKEGIRVDEKAGAVVLPTCGLDELAHTLAACDRVPLKPKDVMEGIRSRQAEVEKWKKDCESLPAQEVNLATLKAFLIQGERYKLLLPELKHIRAQLELLESIESYTKSSETLTYDNLSELINKAISNNISDAVLAPIKQALEKARTLLSDSEKLIQLCSTSYDHIDQLYQCLKDLKERKMQSEPLEYIAKCYEWHKQIVEKFNKIPEPDCAALESFSTEELEDELAEAARIEPLVGPAQSLQRRIKQVAWSRTAKSKLDPTVKLNAEELKTLVETMNTLGLDRTHTHYGELCKLAQDSYNKYREIYGQYEALLGLDVDKMNETQLEAEVEKIRALKQSCFTSQVNMSECINRLHKLEKWVLAYQTLVRLIEAKESSGISPAVFVRAYENCAAVQEGMKSKVVEKAGQQVERYRNWTEQFARYKAMKKELHDEDAATGTLFDVETIKKMVAESASIEFPLSQEVAQLKADIVASEQNEASAKEFLKSQPDAEIKIEELQKLVQSIQALPLYSKSLMCALKSMLWIAHVKQIFDSQAQNKPKRSIEEWTALIKERERLISLKPDDESSKASVLHGEMVEKFISQHREAMLLAKQVSDLKSGEVRDDFSIVDLELLLDLMKKSPVDFGADFSFVGDMLDAARSFENKLNELKKSKAAFEEYDILKERIKKIPVDFGEVKKELDYIIESSETLAKRIDLIGIDFQRRKAKMSETLVSDLLGEYAKIPCTFDEAEELKQKLDYCKNVIMIAKEKLTPGKTVSLDEISQISKNLCDLPLDMTESVKSIKLEICRRKYEAIILNAEGADYNKPGFGTIKSLANDFSSLNDVADSLDAAKIKHLRELAEEAGRDIESIQKISDKDELSKLEAELAAKPIDYSEPIIEQRTRITLRQTAKPTATVSALFAGKREKAESSSTGRIWDPSDEEMRQGAVFRGNTRVEFKEIIRENERLIREQTSEWFANRLEADLFGNSKDVNVGYKETAEVAKRALRKIADFPLVSSYIGSGKLPLWKLCKIKDQGVLTKKLNKIEGLLSKKGKKKKVEEDFIDPEAAATARRNLRLNLLLQEDKSGLKPESPEKYDPLQPVLGGYSGQMYDPSALIVPHEIPSVPEPVPAAPQPIEQKNGDESLESVEIAGGKTFSSDEEEKQPPLFDPAGQGMYQPGIGLPGADVPYNPLDVDTTGGRYQPQMQAKPSTGLGPAPRAKPKGRSVLVPCSYDPTSIEAEPKKDIPPGTLLHVWTGKMETGKVVFSCDMMTCESVKEYYNAPALATYIEIDGRAKVGEVMQYLDSNFNIPKVLILRGWVTPIQTPESIENITKYVAELEKAGKCGVIDIKEMNSHIYLIPWNARNQQFLHKWGIFPVGEQPLTLPLVKLAYFFAFKRRESLGMYKTMRPIEVRKLEPSEAASSGYTPVQVASGFPGIAQAEELSDEEDLHPLKAQPQSMQVPQPIPIEEPSPRLMRSGPTPEEQRAIEEAKAQEAIARNLKEKLAALTPEEIETLRGRLDEKNRESFQRLIDEVFPQGIYGPRAGIMEPIPAHIPPPMQPWGSPRPSARMQDTPSEPMMPPPPNVPMMMPKPEMQPMRQVEPPVQLQNLANDPNYNRKVQTVQNFIEKNKAFFMGFLQNLSQGGASGMMFPEQPPPPSTQGRYANIEIQHALSDGYSEPMYRQRDNNNSLFILTFIELSHRYRSLPVDINNAWTHQCTLV